MDQIINKYNNRLAITLLVNDVNLGIVKTLNKGLKHIINLKKYEFIARLDAGDICLNDRFKHQKEAFTVNKHLGIVGSWVRFVDMQRNPLFDFKPPVNHKNLKRVIHLYNPFVHASVMYKVDVVKEIGFYTDNYPALEDHAYFFNVLNFFNSKIIPNVLLEYEINPDGISAKQRKVQTKSRIKLLLKEYNFTIIATVGILRALLTHFIPQSFLIKLKKRMF